MITGSSIPQLKPWAVTSREVYFMITTIPQETVFTDHPLNSRQEPDSNGQIPMDEKASDLLDGVYFPRSHLSTSTVQFTTYLSFSRLYMISTPCSTLAKSTPCMCLGTPFSYGNLKVHHITTFVYQSSSYKKTEPQYAYRNGQAVSPACRSFGE